VVGTLPIGVIQGPGDVES